MITKADLRPQVNKILIGEDIFMSLQTVVSKAA
jgi:hypothetical protein